MSDDGPKTRTRGKRPVTEEPKPVKKQPKPKTVYDVSQLQDIAHQLRIYSIQMTIASNSGHPTSCASMAEIMSVLFFTKAGMHYNPKDPKNFGNDRFVLSKGHAAPILYAAWAIAGFVDPAELLKLRKFDSDLEGHPTPKLPFVDVATGSLGQGLSVAGGMAYSSKYLDKIDNRYWVVIGDGECAEGSIWEAAHLASYYKLDNLTAILDINRLGQSQETSIGHDIEVYKKRFEAFGWSVIKVDGHNITALAEAMEKCRNTKNQPQIILAKTFKGKYIEKIENELDWHGKPVPANTIEHLKSLQKSKTLQFDLTPEVPESRPERHHFTLATEYALMASNRRGSIWEGFGCFEQGRYKSLDCGSGWRHQELNFCLNIQGCYSNQFRGVSELKNVFSRVPIALIRGLVQIASALRSSQDCSRAFSAQITSTAKNA